MKIIFNVNQLQQNTNNNTIEMIIIVTTNNRDRYLIVLSFILTSTVYFLFKNEIVKYNETSLFCETTDIETNIDCSDIPGTSYCTKELSGNVTNTQEEGPNQFVKPATPKRKILILKESEKKDPQIQKALDFLQQPIPKNDLAHTFGKHESQKLKSI